MSQYEQQAKYMGRSWVPHESVFRISSDPFRTYMSMVDPNWFPPEQLIYYSSEMAAEADRHPLLGYASGWAAADAAFHRDLPKSWVKHDFPLPDRLAALSFASNMWERSEREFHEAAVIEPDPERAARLEDFRWRSSLALEYLPMMCIAANWFAGNELPEEDVERAMQMTSDGLIDLVFRMRGEPSENGLIEQAKGGLSSEIFAGLLILKSPTKDFIVSPGSIHLDNHPDSGLRTDLLAIETGGAHRIAPLQVTGKRGVTEPMTDERVNIRTRKDLVLREGQLPGTALNTFIYRDGGILDNPHSGVLLDRRTAELVERIHTFNRKPKRREVLI